MKKFTMSVLVHRSGMDFSGNGISNQFDKLDVVFFPEWTTEKEIRNIVINDTENIQDNNLIYFPRPNMRPMAVPAHVLRGQPIYGKEVDRAYNSQMFGGNFVYSSDSNCPNLGPIHVHDRVELYQR